MADERGYILIRNSGANSLLAPCQEDIDIPCSAITSTDVALGRGQFGEVLLGRMTLAKSADTHWRAEERDVALKVFKDGTRSIPEEASFLYRIKSPHIVGLYGAARYSDSVTLVLEKCDGTLDAYLRSLVYSERLSEPTCVNIVRQIVEGLSVIHAQKPKTVHGDMKSANILYVRQGAATFYKICDFGASYPQYYPTGTVGDIYWAAPEVVLGVTTGVGYTPNPASDVYSLGCVIFDILGREIPWAGLSFDEIRTQVVTSKKAPQDYRGVHRPELVEYTGLRTVMQRCTAFDPEKRPTVEVLKRDLKECKGDAEAEMSSDVLGVGAPNPQALLLGSRQARPESI